MDMWTGRVACRAFESDDLTLAHGVAGMDGDARKVTVQGHETLGMDNHHVNAIADQISLSIGTRACQQHGAIRGCVDRRVQRRRDVEPGVEVSVADALLDSPWLNCERCRAEALRDGTDHRSK